MMSQFPVVGPGRNEISNPQNSSDTEFQRVLGCREDCACSRSIRKNPISILRKFSFSRVIAPLMCSSHSIFNPCIIRLFFSHSQESDKTEPPVHDSSMATEKTFPCDEIFEAIADLFPDKGIQ